MNTSAKLGAYVLGLAVIFGGALGAGSAVGAVGTPAADGHRPHTASPPTQPADGRGTHAGPETGQADSATAAHIPGGLQVSQDGYTLTPETTKITPGQATGFRFTVTGPDGRPVTGYQIQHDKKLHFIVVSRDLDDFQHLHPELLGDGVWSVKLTLPEAGAYRAFADFAPEGGTGMTLGADLYADGDHTAKALPAASRTSTVDGYSVTLTGDLVPGGTGKLTLKVSKDGRPVTDLQPYLGAYGHLVALRAGDLAYLHVHPDGEPGDGRTRSGPEITFQAEAPSRGDYRLFLDFQHEGTVRTADFTVHAGEATSAPPADPATTGSHGEHTH
ncbi:hypothetical protein FHR32_008378 [Streptosporangium album]|uniref:Secreted protein n=1 Tax=Streptosporangium album TaxID=47479 RepID=A0A7W7WDR5_9ACTN|nr:hypothetical protein [Streptosporangium album]MBB4943977.1 hypothetical protein [Streptosporangium album]